MSAVSKTIQEVNDVISSVHKASASINWEIGRLRGERFKYVEGSEQYLNLTHQIEEKEAEIERLKQDNHYFDNLVLLNKMLISMVENQTVSELHYGNVKFYIINKTLLKPDAMKFDAWFSAIPEEEVKVILEHTETGLLSKYKQEFTSTEFAIASEKPADAILTFRSLENETLFHWIKNRFDIFAPILNKILVDCAEEYIVKNNSQPIENLKQENSSSSNSINGFFSFNELKAIG